MPTPREGLRRALLHIWAGAWQPFRRGASAALPDSPRILVIRPDHLGDLLFSGPALRLLRATFPSARITALVGPWGKGVAERLPGIDEVLTCPFPGFARSPKASLLAPYRLLVRESRRLSEFDLAIVLRYDHWWGALLAHAAGIPRRWGYDIAECRPFLTLAVPYVRGRHEAAQNIRLIEAGCRTAHRSHGDAEPDARLIFAVSDEERARIDDVLLQRGVGPGDRLVAIHPGAGAAVKYWPPERYAEVGDTLGRRLGVKIIITGSRAELGLAWQVASAMQTEAIVAAGETTLGELAALLSRCELAIGSDSGPMHLAVAMGTRTVHMYGPADPALFGPWAPGNEGCHRSLISPMDCVPCNRLDYPREELAAHPCMEGIGVNAVLAEAEALLAETAP